MHVRSFGMLRAFATGLSLVMAMACTMKETEVPPLTGPSELAQSIQLLANPDVLTQDGASQSQITIVARNANGQPQRDVSLRAEILVNGTTVDFGRLSARTVVTGADGRATLTYTAPPPPPEPVDTFTVVSIVVVPSGTDFANAVERTVNIRLVPPGVILPPVGTPTPRFTFSPSSPLEAQTVQFTAAQTDIGTNAATATFQWSFGDGSTATGINTSHAFSRAGTYNVTLTVTNDRGRSASVTQFVTVGAGQLPSNVAFTVSPAQPALNELVTFVATAQAAPGRQITSYEWTFGDGERGTGQSTTHRFTRTGTFVVNLTVTDDAGKTASASQTVVVGGGAAPTAAFTFSPTNPRVNDTVNFDASTSTAPPGRTIVSYSWTFGDGTTGAGQRVSHAYGAAGDFVVGLTVTDNTGASNTATRTVTVAAQAPQPPPGGPTAAFEFSPSNPVVNQTVNFDASTSVAQSGRTITSYEWSFGDGTIATGQRVTHVYNAAGNYTVILTVTDSGGARDTETKTVPVAGTTQNPTASFNLSPSPASVGQQVVADASPSTAQGGATIVRYQWNWGDSTQNEICSNPAAPTDHPTCGGTNRQTISHVYTVAGTYTITLTITDSNGRTGTTTRTLTVNP
jgi:PKD repeat protein